MPDASVIDTNVLIVASAADDGSVFPAEGTPVGRPEDREAVLSWLTAFERDDSRHVVLDWHWHLCGEYQNKLHPGQDYGWLVIMAKQDRNQVAWVGLEVDEHGHAVLDDPLSSAVTDLADRKMVAAVLAAQADGHDCKLINACDTDWLDCAQALGAVGVEVTHLLPDWLREVHAAKRA